MGVLGRVVAHRMFINPVHSRTAIILAVSVAATLAAMNHVVFAQQAAFASSNSEAATKLAKQALASLRRGEEEATPAARLAAYRDGVRYAERAVAADDSNADAHFALFANRGRILLLEGVVVNAFTVVSANRELDRALELNPDHADALAAKGGLYRQLPWVLGGSNDKAKKYLTRAIELDPRAVIARIELAEIYRDAGHPDDAVPLLEKAASVAEDDGKYRQLARARALLHELGH